MWHNFAFGEHGSTATSDLLLEQDSVEELIDTADRFEEADCGGHRLLGYPAGVVAIGYGDNVRVSRWASACKFPASDCKSDNLADPQILLNALKLDLAESQKII
jgi:hypothetical protein